MLGGEHGTRARSVQERVGAVKGRREIAEHGDGAASQRRGPRARAQERRKRGTELRPSRLEPARASDHPRRMMGTRCALGLWATVGWGLVLASGCSTRQAGRDAAAVDGHVAGDAGSEPDAGTVPDTGSRDGGADAALDAAMADAAALDGASVDAGPGDAGARDAALDVPLSCPGAIAIAPGDTLDGTTVGAGDDLEPGGSHCPSASADGNDVLYRFHAPAAGTFRFVVTPTGMAFDPMLYRVSDCAAAACVDGTVLNGAGEMETFDVTVAAGEDVLLVVDGELFSEGAYRLALTGI